jgi:hypothetical protein
MAKFNVTVNPFSHTIVVSSKTRTGYQEVELVADSLMDEWSSFEIGSNVYDIHFYYDQEFSVSIYDAEDNAEAYQNSHSVKLIIKLKDA